MSINDYHFVSHWRVEATANEVADILQNSVDLARWWPSVYLNVEVLEPGDGHGVGKLVRLHSKGWLPYSIRWQFRVTESRYPFGYTLQAFGDFAGRGCWTFAQDGSFVNMTYDWKIRAEKVFIKAFSFLLKPIFAANHNWAMARGEESLRLELARRRASTPEEAALIPAPRGPTFPHSLRYRRKLGNEAETKRETRR